MPAQSVRTVRFISAPRMNTEGLGVAGPSRNYSNSGDLVVVNGLTAGATFLGERGAERTWMRCQMDSTNAVRLHCNVNCQRRQ